MYQIIRIEAARTKNGSPMWRCLTETGEKVNFFLHNDPGKDNRAYECFVGAGYESEIVALQVGQVQFWKQHPICVEMVKDGDWWTISTVQTRPDGAIPDPSYMPDLNLYADWARRSARHLVESPMLPIVFWDSETTGTREDDELISIGILNRNGEPLLSRLFRPANPERLAMPIWGEGLTPTDKTGITPEMVEEALPFAESYHLVKNLLSGSIWVIYNADFDVRLLRQTCLRYGLPPIPSIGVNCAMKLFAAYNGEWKPEYQDFASKKLEWACEKMLVPLRHSHDAVEDAMMMFELVKKMAGGI